MRTLNYSVNQNATFGRKFIAIAALAALLTLGFGPLEAGATTPSGVAPGNYPCVSDGSNSGYFAISYENGQVVASDLNQDCEGTAVIPEGVTKVGLFQWNNALLQVEIPASVTEIAAYAFAQSINLATVSIADNSLLTRIPEAAFSYTGLSAFRVPASVTSIGSFAFENTSSLTSVSFQVNSQLQTIERGAFKGTTLSAINLPPSLTTLGNEVFENVQSLNSVTFEEGSQLTTIGNNVFNGVGTINPPDPRPTIALPSTVTTIGLSPFGSNVNLTIPDSNQHFSIENGVLFNKNQTTLIAYATWLQDVTYVIPASVTAIGPGAFADSRLQTINIPSTVLTIGSYAFARSNQLTTLTFPADSSITTIPNEAFQSTRLEVIEIPASVTIIQRYAFQDIQRAPGATVLTQLTFAPNSALEEIHENAFSAARLAASIQIPASVHTIGPEAFYNNVSLNSVTFGSGSNLRRLGRSALQATGVTSLSLPPLPTRSSFTPMGWSNTEDGSVILEPGPAATSVIAWSALYAIYQPHPTVTFDSTLGSAVADMTFAPGESIDAPNEPTRTGFNFSGWSLTDGGAEITFPFEPTSNSNFTLYALWTEAPTITAGSEPDSRVVSIPVGLTAAEVPATANLPRVSLAFAATNAAASATIVPIANPADAASTPFVVASSTKIVDIQVSGITGPVTVCLDGASTDDIFHFTGGAWVTLPNRSYVNGQVCGVTTNFSPFAAAAPSPAPTSTLPRPVAALPVPVFEMGSRPAVSEKGQRLILQGKNLNLIDSITVGGKEVNIIQKSAGELVIDVPASAEGYPEVVVLHKNGTLTIQGWLQVVAPYALTRSIKITRFVGDRPTLAGIAALERTFLAGRTANIVTCIMTVAVDASVAEVAKAEMRARKTCQRVVKLSARFKPADVRVVRSGEPGSKPVLSVTFDRTLSGS